MPRPFKVRSLSGSLPSSSRLPSLGIQLSVPSRPTSNNNLNEPPLDTSSVFSRTLTQSSTTHPSPYTSGYVDSREVVANLDPQVLRVFVIRHGQTNENLQKILQGHLDTALNATGVEQARKVGEALREIPFEDFACSDLLRCRQTLHYIQRYHPRTQTRYTADLRERDIGVCQGMKLEDALAHYGTEFRHLGEEKQHFLYRIDREWTRVLKTNPTSRNIAICTHGGVVTGFLNHLYQLGYSLSDKLQAENLRVPFNTLIAVVDVNRESGAGIIQTFGNTDHLGGKFEVAEQLLR